MPSYNVEILKSAIAVQESKANKKTEGQKENKVSYYKPGMGEHEIRFLPFKDSTGQPVLEVWFYNNKDFLGQEKRVIAPFQFGLPDPIKDSFEELRKPKDGWDLAKALQPTPAYYCLILDRAEETKNALIWEMKKETRHSFYTLLTNKHNQKKDLLSPTEGADFLLTVSPKVGKNGEPEMFNGYPLKQFILAKGEHVPLHEDPKRVEEILASMPNLEEMFKKMVRSPERLNEMLEAYLIRKSGATSQLAEPEAPVMEVQKSKSATKANAQTTMRIQAEQDVSSVFDDV